MADRSPRYRTTTYIQGNTVHKASTVPKRRQAPAPTKPKQPKKVSVQVKKNQRRAMHMSSGYVVFLSIATVLAVVVCVTYLQLQADITNRSKNITTLQQELSAVKEANNTMYNTVLDSVNLEDVRSIAVNEMGMVYATPEQVIEYKNPASNYVKQLEEIPQSGVLAQSDKASK